MSDSAESVLLAEAVKLLQWLSDNFAWVEDTDWLERRDKLLATYDKLRSSQSQSDDVPLNSDAPGA